MSHQDDRYSNRRFQIPDIFKKWKSRYDFNTDEMQNLQQQSVDAIYTEVIDLSTARLPSNPYLLGSKDNPASPGVAGRAVEVKGLTTSTVYNFSTNAGIETVDTAALINMWINKPGTPSNFLPSKNGDGYRGDFLQIWLFWPAQSSKSMRINVFKFDDMPWMSGDFST